MARDDKKIVITLHEGEKVTNKIWRFNNTSDRYSKEETVKEILSLFPHLVKKGLDLDLYHYDELAGKVDIESDGDLVGALENFKEEMSRAAPRKDYLILHAKGASPVMIPLPKLKLHAKERYVTSIGAILLVFSA
jgi:hypothetical protein